MDDTELAERLHDLQVSLKDGDDLARAITLIGDALERRMHAIRESLDDLHQLDTDRARVEEIVGRVGETLDDYEGRLEERHRRMQDLVEDFQASLGEEAAALSDLEAGLDGTESRTTADHLPSSEGSAR